MKSKRWKELIYQGGNFGDRFQISEDGEIRRIETGKVFTVSYIHGNAYSKLNVYGKTITVRLSKAQVESGFERTVWDNETPSHK